MVQNLEKVRKIIAVQESKYVQIQKNFEPIMKNQNGLTRKHFTWCASIIYAKLLPQVQLRV